MCLIIYFEHGKRKGKKEKECFLVLNQNDQSVQPDQGCVVNFGNSYVHTATQMELSPNNISLKLQGSEHSTLSKITSQRFEC